MNNSEIDSLSTREEFLSNHPILLRNYTVLTPAISDTYNVIRDRVLTRGTGVFLYASPRMGKTKSAAAIQDLLTIEFPKIYFVRFSADLRSTTKNEMAIVRDIIESQGLLILRRSTYKELMSRLLLHIKTNVDELGSNHFVLMIDEMQMLSEDDYRVLLVIHNRLEMSGISMTTLGFAQPEILERRSSMLTTKAYNLIARFLCEPVRFSGCNGKEDLGVILNAYDNEKTYPHDKPWTYTQFFLPKAYDNGFRLGSFNEQIWSGLHHAMGHHAKNGIPMEYLTRMIEKLLLANMSDDSPVFSLNEHHIDSAITASNLKNFLGLMSS